METKRCSCCKSKKPVEEFSTRTKNKKQYLMNLCNGCNAERVRIYHKDVVVERVKNLRKYIIYTIFDGKCNVCGYSDYRALQIDHIRGNGAKERKEIGAGYKYLKHVVEVNGEGYQILCANCNVIKKVENKENRWNS